MILKQRSLCSVYFPFSSTSILAVVFIIMSWGFLFCFCLAYLGFPVVKHICGDECLRY